MSMSISKENLIELNSNDMCLAISMDVVGSEKYSDKSVIENKLSRITRSLNLRYKNYLVVPFQIRGGDEVLGVISSFSRGFYIYRYVRRLAWKHNIELYFGMGFGTLDTGSIIDINRINGSAVINACRAVDKYLKNKSKDNSLVYSQDKQHVKFFALGDNNIPYPAVNALVYTIYNELNKSEKQRELIKLIELNPKLTYEELGIMLGYDLNNSKSNVSKLLARSDYDVYLQMQKDLFNLLSKIQKLCK
ncbi:SatD family protein [Bacillus thuringiensis]|uniref:SatD family protein n=1 Tax=Bacillus thuringiensis TaxID=1428 RepID=UPI00366E72DE